MSRFLLDTDHYTLLEFGHPPLLRNLLGHDAGDISISVISVEEAFRGRIAKLSRVKLAEDRIRAYRRLERTLEIIGNLNVTSFDERSEEQFQALRSSKLRIGTPDLRIASIALAHSLIVVTRNRRDFGRVPGLILEDWSSP